MQHRHHLILAVLGTLAAPLAQVQSQLLRLIVPYAAGGPVDITARALAERVKDTLGPVIVENRPELAATSAPTPWPKPRRMG